jgi:hypothetical protein
LAPTVTLLQFDLTLLLERLDENISAVAVNLTQGDMQEIEAALSNITIQGDRYPANLQQMTKR